MALPIRPNNPNIPIPNSSFSSPLNLYVAGPYFPVVMGSGIDISTGDKVSNLNNEGVLDFSGATGNINLVGGAGISVVKETPNGDTNFTVSNTGVIQLIAGGNVSITGSDGVYTISASDAQTGTVTSVGTGVGLTGGPITTSGTISLDVSGVTPGSYTYPSITVDAYGRLTVASNGVTPVATITGTAPVQVTGSAPSLTVSVAPSSTVAPGIVQLEDGTSSTSTTTAATPNSVKTAYDAATAAQATADAALPLAGGTMSGPIVFAPGQTFPTNGIADATTSSKGIVQVGTNIGVTGGVISVASASTSQLGVVQLNDSTNSTSTSEALTAAQGKNLQDQITALSVASNITLGGTYNASTGLVDSVTTEGTAAGLVVGSPLPAASPSNNEIFVIIDVQGSTGPSGTPPYHVGDWYLSNGTTWQFLNVGYQPAQATTLSQGTVQLATDAQVQAGTDSSNAVVSSSLQSKLSDSVSTTSSTTIASSTAVKTANDAAVGAQTDATQALSDAAAAQADATQALANAASAQSTADAALPLAGGTMTGGITFNAGQTFPGTVSEQDFQAVGDLVAGYGVNTFGILSVGTDGQILSANSAVPSGLSWINNRAPVLYGPSNAINAVANRTYYNLRWTDTGFRMGTLVALATDGAGNTVWANITIASDPTSDFSAVTSSSANAFGSWSVTAAGSQTRVNFRVGPTSMPNVSFYFLYTAVTGAQPVFSASSSSAASAS